MSDTRTVIDCCDHCGGEVRRSVYDLQGRLLCSGTPFGRLCLCDYVFEELKPLLLVLAQCAEVQAYGDARQAAERADVVAFLADVEALYEIETPLPNHPLKGARSVEYFMAHEAIGRGEHVGAVEREKGR